jgi:hypothetical protein
MLRAFGRDVDVEAFALSWDERTLLMSAGDSREEHRELSAVRRVCEAIWRLPDDPLPKTGEVKSAIRGVDANKRDSAILAAEERGFIERPDGPNKAKLCRLTARGVGLVAGG